MDSGDQADEVWLLGIQRKLYQWSRKHPEDSYGDLWNWVTDPRNLRSAWRRIARNKGSRTAGVDGMTVASIRSTMGEEAFLERLRDDLRTGRYQPSPSRRKLIPKPGQPGKFRPLGIPTVRDRVVQGAVKNLLEPIFEATFWHVSYGFRPGRGCHGALEHIRMTMRPRAKAGDGRRQRTPYQWVIEGDIKGCFDHIDHHKLMLRVRARIGDLKVTRLIGHFLKAGVLSDGFLLPTNEGRRTCDGVTAALRARMGDRKAGRPVFFPVRYADDFVILVSGTREQAEQEKADLASHLRETMSLELSDDKTRVSDPTEGFAFLGHRVRYKWHPRFGFMPRIEIPNAKRADLRYAVKQVTNRSTTTWSLSHLLQKLNPVLRGWGNYFRFCTGAGQLFASLDFRVGDRIWRWLMKKHGRLSRKRTALRRLPSRLHPTRRVWREGRTEQFLCKFARNSDPLRGGFRVQ